MRNTISINLKKAVSQNLFETYHFETIKFESKFYATISTNDEANVLVQIFLLNCDQKMY